MNALFGKNFNKMKAKVKCLSVTKPYFKRKSNTMAKILEL